MGWKSGLKKVYAAYRKIPIPDIFTKKDAQYFVEKSEDPAYAFGPDYKTCDDLEARVLSINPESYKKIRKALHKSGKWHVAPFVFGTYNLTTNGFRMNDIPLMDLIYFAIFPEFALVSVAPIAALRTLYYGGRRSWWRHEAIHARHHHGMSDYIVSSLPRWKRECTANKLNSAGATVYESGLEELLTRWQTIKESRGPREKFFSWSSMLLYTQYLPFMAFRNMLNDVKDRIHHAFKNYPRLRFTAKAATFLSAMIAPGVALFTYREGFSQYAADQIQHALSPDTIRSLLARVYSFYLGGVFGAAFSMSKKGVYEDFAHDGPMKTKDYKFPYTYRPLVSLSRSINLMRYLNKVWDNIPNYRKISSVSDLSNVKRDVGQRLEGKLNKKQYEVTMKIMDKVLSNVNLPRDPVTRRAKPYDLYLKGDFISAFYLHAKELFT